MRIRTALNAAKVLDIDGPTAAAATNVGTFLVEITTPPTVVSAVLGDGTNQRSVVRQVVVTFSESVSFAGATADAFRVTRTGSGGTVGDVTLTANPANGPAGAVTLTFSGPLTEFGSLTDGLYNLSIDAAKVTGLYGLLDGNADGTGGDNYAITGTTANRWFRLFGDSDGDTDLADFRQIKAAFGSTGFGGNYNAAFDFDGDGDNDLGDFNQFKARIGVII